MKFSKLTTTAVVLIVGLTVLGCEPEWSSFDKGTVNRKADFKLKIGGGGLKIDSYNGHVGRCKINRNRPDCVGVPKGNTAEIKFQLKGWKDWNFTKMQLVAEPSDKLEFGTQSGFSEGMIEDFYVYINGRDGEKREPDSDGIINLTGVEDGRNFTLHDNNIIEQTYRYQIQACLDEECEPTDPMIENEGRR